MLSHAQNRGSHLGAEPDALRMDKALRGNLESPRNPQPASSLDLRQKPKQIPGLPSRIDFVFASTTVGLSKAENPPIPQNWTRRTSRTNGSTRLRCICNEPNTATLGSRKSTWNQLRERRERSGLNEPFFCRISCRRTAR